jgi:hypothetical protein
MQDWSEISRVDGRIHVGNEYPELVIIDDIDPQNPIQSIIPQQLLPNAQLIQLVSDINSILEICNKLDINIPKYRIVSELDSRSIHNLRDKLGRLVIMKELLHLPSWHAEKKRGVFLDLEDPADRIFLEKSSRNRSVIVQTVMNSSKDIINIL